MKTVRKPGALPRRKKIVLQRGKASEILEAVHVKASEERRAKAALEAVSRRGGNRFMGAAARKAAARKAAEAKRLKRYAKMSL